MPGRRRGAGRLRGRGEAPGHPAHLKEGWHAFRLPPLVRRLTADEIAVFDHIPSELSAGVRVVEVPVLTPGADAMTLGRTILVRRGHTGSQRLMAHELVHVQQWSRLGRIGFLRQYLAAYGRSLMRLRRHRDAYLAIPLEVEARERARRWDEGLRS